jgi:hypothetical protein
MSWPPGGQLIAEDPELTECERESVAPLAEWVVTMVRNSEGSVSRTIAMETLQVRFDRGLTNVTRSE